MQFGQIRTEILNLGFGAPGLAEQEGKGREAKRMGGRTWCSSPAKGPDEDPAKGRRRSPSRRRKEPKSHEQGETSEGGPRAREVNGREEKKTSAEGGGGERSTAVNRQRRGDALETD